MRLLDLFEARFQEIVHTNPSVATLKALARANRYHSARFVIYNDGMVKAADSEHFTHHSMAPAMGAWAIRGYVQYVGDGEYLYRSMEVYSPQSVDHPIFRVWERAGIENGNPEVVEEAVSADPVDWPSDLGWKVQFKRFRSLDPLLPSRQGKIYLMPFKNWQGTWYSLTGKDISKIKFMPTDVYEIPPDAQVGDMRLINQAHSTKNADEKAQLLSQYKDTMISYTDFLKNPNIFDMPEILADPLKVKNMNFRVTVLWDKNKKESILGILPKNIKESWTKKYKKSINCNAPKGFSQRAHCAARRKRRAGGTTTSKSVNEANNTTLSSPVRDQLNAWMELDQQYEDPTKRKSLQAKVWPYIQKNLDAIMSDLGPCNDGDYPAAPFAAWLLVQHMDAFPQNQVTFYKQLAKAIPNHPKLQFLWDRAAVNAWIQKHATNPKYYHDGKPLPDPTINVRNPDMFRDAGIQSTSREQALQNAKQAGNKLLVAAVLATDAQTQPSFTQTQEKRECAEASRTTKSKSVSESRMDTLVESMLHNLQTQGLTEAEAVSYIDERLDENLRKWFKQKWVRFGPDGKIRGACARGSEGEGKPKCLPQRKAWALGKKKRATAARRKRREDPNPERRGRAKNVATKESQNFASEMLAETAEESQDINTLAKFITSNILQKREFAYTHVYKLVPADKWPKIKSPIIQEMLSVLRIKNIKDPTRTAKGTIGRDDDGSLWMYIAPGRDPIETASTVAHELTHALDLIKSQGKAFKSGSYEAKPDSSVWTADDWKNYIGNPMEINARFAQVLMFISDDVIENLHNDPNWSLSREELINWITRLFEFYKIDRSWFAEGSKGQKSYNRLLSRTMQFYQQLLKVAQQDAVQKPGLLKKISTAVGSQVAKLISTFGLGKKGELDEDFFTNEPVYLYHSTSKPLSAFRRNGLRASEWEDNELTPYIGPGIHYVLWFTYHPQYDYGELALRFPADALSKKDAYSPDRGSFFHDKQPFFVSPENIEYLDNGRWRPLQPATRKNKQAGGHNGKAKNVATKESVGGTTLGSLCTIKTNFPEADFWLVRRGDRKNVGKPTKEFSPYHIGIKVTDLEKLMPQYLYYMMMHLHNQGYWLSRSMGTTALVNIRTEDVKNIQLALTEHELKENSSCPHCGGHMVSHTLLNEKKDACYYKVKSRYKVWPSAYASGALVQCRKKGAKNWGNKGKKQ